jgi:nucleoid DNA-binding protein
MRVNKQKLVQAIIDSKDSPKVSKTVVALIVDLFIEEIKVQFKKGNSIEIRGFGTLYPYFKKARTYNIPRLKETREVKGRMTLKFKPSRQILIYEE